MLWHTSELNREKLGLQSSTLAIWLVCHKSGYDRIWTCDLLVWNQPQCLAMLRTHIGEAGFEPAIEH